MRKSQFQLLIIMILFLMCFYKLNGQDVTAEEHSYKPIILKLNESGTKYLRFIMMHQFWVIANQNNPGTLDVNGMLIDGTNGSNAWTTDIALRRSRYLAISQISPRFLILAQWGINNQSFINGATPPSGTNSNNSPSNQGKKPQLFLHDAWTEYRVIQTKFYIGAGLHYWNGVSRMSSHSILGFMPLDAPIFNWPNIEATDQFARQFGIYAKGQIGKLDYRISFNKPFVNGLVPNQIPKNGIASNVTNENNAVAGYFSYMLKDKESNILPYYTGTYYGSKNILNVGFGFYNHIGASLVKTQTDSIYQNHLALGTDIFIDKPIDKLKGTALSILGTLYYFDYGNNYLRNIGILNEHTTATTLAQSFAGGGNSQPMIGTGFIGYIQAGYLLPKMNNGTSFMPYITAAYKNFERLKDPSFQWAAGLNYIISGHNAKITLEYATRPIYKTNDLNEVINIGNKVQFTLQSVIFL
ncbi:MAG: hypothetical protein RIR48_979 [Bacteroidota bacterium]|jgi:hypothetical protein